MNPLYRCPIFKRQVAGKALRKQESPVIADTLARYTNARFI